MTGPSAAAARLRALADTGGLDELCREYGVRVLTVFGSAARGEAVPRDLDVGVLTESGHAALPPGFGVALADLAEIGEVDLVHLDRGAHSSGSARSSGRSPCTRASRPRSPTHRWPRSPNGSRPTRCAA